jgi:hypothetical protein
MIPHTKERIMTTNSRKYSLKIMTKKARSGGIHM